MDKIALTIGEPGNTIRISGPDKFPEGGIDSIGEILRVGILFLLIASVLLSLSFLIWGGIDWILAGGNKESMNRARNKITFAVLGLFVVFTAFAVINLIANFFGIGFWKLR